MSSNDSITTPSSMAVDFTIGIFAILYITNIVPLFFIALMCFILAGAIIGTIQDCRKW